MTTPLVQRLLGTTTVVESTTATLLFLSYPAMLVAALLGSLPAFAVAAGVSLLTDHLLHHRRVPLVARLARARAGLTIRFLLRELLLILLLVRADLAEPAVLTVAVAGFVLFHAFQAPHTGLVMMLRRRRRLPVATRNIDLSTLPVPDGAPRALTHRATEKMLHLELPLFAGLLTAAVTGTVGHALIGAAVTTTAALLYALALLPYLRAAKLPPSPEYTLEWFDGWLRTHQPTVVLYFSGSQDSAYQVNMWLETVERLDAKSVVILRERNILPQLSTTTLPVLCVPSAVDLMNLDLSMLRVGLYPANVGKNLHLLRVPTMKHVFIGHGDSDKIASINPYTKAYDEVWTAGRAGRDRYALADVGVRGEDIVEVGRPQLAPIRPAGEPVEGRIPTILYAPTWEGWTDDPGNTSLILAGENIVRRLVEAPVPVRVLYKPHPFTGMRSAVARAADQRIRDLIGKAAADRAADPRWAAETERTAADRARAAQVLREIDKRRAAKTESDELGTWDDASVSRDALTPSSRAAEEAAVRAEWNEAFWRSFGWWEHRVITGPAPLLFDCFNESAALVSDISSVVSDFVASGKPYAVTDSAGLGAEEFRRQNTAVRAAVILDNTAGGLTELLAAVHEPSADPLTEEREELKEYLLGPDRPTSPERFQAAIDDLTARADARNSGVIRIPAQATPPTTAPGVGAGAP
ncbi:hypothetical protein [Streptomyces sp. ST2-7A]|uniref:hypothetical protein n=1 Tax=Streptomyces sp. ST2-7A TaxID=2907214 RepID=UPI001F3BC333|nr:hypothetical protein [Streptomyces sp. ST2-7A]MCE7079211.1 hypothetical protein [Streptomyces sp. ST2-7A]